MPNKLSQRKANHFRKNAFVFLRKYVKRSTKCSRAPLILQKQIFMFYSFLMLFSISKNSRYSARYTRLRLTEEKVSGERQSSFALSSIDPSENSTSARASLARNSRFFRVSSFIIFVFTSTMNFICSSVKDTDIQTSSLPNTAENTVLINEAKPASD